MQIRNKTVGLNILHIDACFPLNKTLLHIKQALLRWLACSHKNHYCFLVMSSLKLETSGLISLLMLKTVKKNINQQYHKALQHWVFIIYNHIIKQWHYLKANTFDFCSSYILQKYQQVRFVVIKLIY